MVEKFNKNQRIVESKIEKISEKEIVCVNPRCCVGKYLMRKYIETGRRSNENEEWELRFGRR